MPVILENSLQCVANKISENLKEGFKKSEKENHENQLSVTVKQVLSANIEYEESPNNISSQLNSLQTKYIVLKPNQPPLQQQATNAPISYAKVLKTNDGNERSTSNGTSSSATSKASTPSSLQLPKPARELFDKSKIQIGWGPQCSNWGSGVGYNNAGNTCYLNSALQAFLHVPAVAQWLISDKQHRENCNIGSGPCIICSMATTLLSSYRNGSGSMTPSAITSRLQTICKHLTLGRQEDAHEFLRYLVDKMERAYLLRFRNEPWFKGLDQYSKETTPLNCILGGYLRSTVTCHNCKHESVTFQHFEDLSLDISKVSKLTEAIEGYFARENLEECGYKCESCKKRVSASKKFTLERAPAVLCIQLKRFSALGGKIGKPIMITEELSLKKYLSKTSDSINSCKYRFVSMVQHLGGSSSGGHYTAIAKTSNGNFYSFDDSYVSFVPSNAALKPNAYILFYELDKTQMESPRPQHNGHSVIHQNGHTYSKSESHFNGSSSSSSSSMNGHQASTSRSESFSKPALPSMVPLQIMKQQKEKLKQQNQVTPSKNGVKSPGANGEQRVAPLTIKLNNGQKRDGSDHSYPEIVKRAHLNGKPNLPSMPKINGDAEEEKPKNNHSSVQPTPTPATPSKSLVDYSDDDDEDTSNATATKEPNFLRTSSGVFIEEDTKESAKKGPSVKGSTIETKALSEQSVKRGDDAIQQLSKLHHNGYGSSNVMSWGDQPSQMNKEVSKDQQKEDRKRANEHDDDFDMDAGRVKKFKRSNSPNRKPLPNPFQEAQNMRNGNGNHHYDRQISNHGHHNNHNHNNNHKRSFSNNNNYSSYNNGGGGYQGGYKPFHKGYKPNNQQRFNNRNFHQYKRDGYNNYRR